MTQTPRRSASRREDSSPTGESRQGKSRGLPLALVGSVLVHLGIMLLVLPPHFDVFVPAEPKDERPFEVKTVMEEVEPDEPLVAQDLPRDDIVAVDEEPEEEVVEEELEEQEKEEVLEEEEQPPPPETPPPPPPELNKKVVQQESTDEQEPEEADHLAEKANRVDEETQARETTELDVLPGKTVPDDLVETTGGDDESRADEPEDEQEQIADSDEEPGGETPPDAPEEVPPEPEHAERPPEQRPSEPTSPEQREEGDTPALDTPEESALATDASPQQAGEKEAFKPPPKGLFQPTQKEYDELFGEADKKAASTVNQQKKGRRLLKGWKDREAAMRASLENVNLEVRPGNHTGVNASAAVYATFISRIHRKLHPRWGAGYLPRLDSDYGPGHALSKPSLEVTIEYILDAASGEVEATNIVKTSGEMMFDAEAVVIFNEIGPHKGAPDEIISPDGKVYIHWTLWRNQQQCGPWGASIFMVDNGTKKRIDQGGNAGGDASQSGGR